MSADTVTFSIGQVVPWPPAPLGFAQVYDLRRTNVVLCYPKHGRIRRPVVPARRLADLQRATPLLLQLHNPYDRGVVARSKTFVICAPPPVAHLPRRLPEARGLRSR